MLFSFGTTAFADETSVYIKDKKVEFSDVVPQISENGTVLIPLRAVFETMGTEVYWTGDTQTIVCASNDLKLILQIGNPLLFKNNDKTELIEAPVIIQNRTMVTTETIEKAFDVKAEYDEGTVIFK